MNQQPVPEEGDHVAMAKRTEIFMLLTDPSSYTIFNTNIGHLHSKAVWDSKLELRQITILSVLLIIYVKLPAAWTGLHVASHPFSSFMRITSLEV